MQNHFQRMPQSLGQLKEHFFTHRHLVPNAVMIDRSHSCRSRRRRRSRAGYLYVAVLFTSLIVAGSIGVAISLDTARLKTSIAHANRGSALRLAESELHRVATQLASSPDWRTTHTHGKTIDWLEYGAIVGGEDSRTRYQLNDEDGDLSDDVFDTVQVVAHAQFGVAQAAVSVELESGFAPLSMLRYGVTSFGNIVFQDGSALVSERPVQVVGDCKRDGRAVITTSRLECGREIQVPVRGDIGATAVEVPPYSVVERYRSKGTEIDVFELPVLDGVRHLSRVLLSSTQNPYGDQDPNGIYWIDAGGAQITIEDCRLKATLVIVNARKVLLEESLYWTSPNDAGAILISDSMVEIANLEPNLVESELERNFNPVTTPYRQHHHDNDLLDSFPTTLRGILYTASDMRVLPTTDGRPVEVTGLVIARNLLLHHRLSVHAFDEVLETAPLGFVDPRPVRFRSGTYRRIELPQ